MKYIKPETIVETVETVNLIASSGPNSKWTYDPEQRVWVNPGGKVPPGRNK